MTTPTAWRRTVLWIDGTPQPLYRVARKLDLSCRQTLARYKVRDQPVTLEALRQDMRKVPTKKRTAGWNATRNHEKRDQVRTLLAEKKTQAEIARELGVSRQAVHQLVKKLTIAEPAPAEAAA